MNGMEGIIISKLFSTPALICPPFPAMPVQMRKGGRRRLSLSLSPSPTHTLSLSLSLPSLIRLVQVGNGLSPLPSLPVSSLFIYWLCPFQLSDGYIPSLSRGGGGGRRHHPALHQLNRRRVVMTSLFLLPAHCSHPRLELQISLPFLFASRIR